MIRNFFTFAVVIIAFFSNGAAAQAQDYIPYGLNDNNYTASPYFNEMAKNLFFNRPHAFNYGLFRGRYIQTPQYDPLSEDTNEKVLQLAYTVQTEKDAAKSISALEEYRKLVLSHLANMGVVMQAQALSRQDRRFGDADFYARIRAGLLANVMGSGDGNTLQGAYDIITMDEETALLVALRVRVLKTQTRKSGIIYYNMHDVFNPKTKRNEVVFVDVTKPMEFLEEKRLRRPGGVSIPKR